MKTRTRNTMRATSVAQSATVILVALFWGCVPSGLNSGPSDEIVECQSVIHSYVDQPNANDAMELANRYIYHHLSDQRQVNDAGPDNDILVLDDGETLVIIDPNQSESQTHYSPVSDGVDVTVRGLSLSDYRRHIGGTRYGTVRIKFYHKDLSVDWKRGIPVVGGFPYYFSIEVDVDRNVVRHSIL